MCSDTLWSPAIYSNVSHSVFIIFIIFIVIIGNFFNGTNSSKSNILQFYILVVEKGLPAYQEIHSKTDIFQFCAR